MRRWTVALAVLLPALASAAPLQLPQAVVILEVVEPMGPGLVPEAAPPRFVLLEDGQVFVGGTRSLATAKLDPETRRTLERRIADVRKLPLSGTMSFGAGAQRYRLFLKKGRPIDMALSGDPAGAPAVVQPLAQLVRDLASWGHADLRPYTPAGYWMSAREGSLVGGCRRWRGPDKVSAAVFAPRVVPALEVKEREWPTGAVAASLCEGEKRYIVTFRPMLPGEAP
jgi:hypothetical protein